MAADPKIQLDIVTPQKLVYSDKIDMLEGPAIDGLIGILPRHAPLVTAMKIGIVKVRKDGEDKEIAISEGFMEVQPDRINLVVRTAEMPEEIDVERAEAAKERAKERIESEKDSIDFVRAEAAYERSIARLKVAQHKGHSLGSYDR